MQADAQINIIAQIDKLNAEAWNINRTKPAEGIKLAEEALTQSQQLNYKKGIAYALANKGACNIWPGNYDQSLKFSLDAQILLQELNDKEKEADVLYNIFCVFYFLSDYDKALKYAYENYNLANEINNPSKKAAALNAIGTIQYTMGENEKSIATLNEALHLAEQIHDENLMVRILDGLGTANSNIGNYHKTVEYNNQSLEIASKLGIKQVVSYALDGLGTAYKALNEFEKSQQHYLQSLELRREMNFKAGEAESLLHLGELYLHHKHLNKAKDNLEKALVLSEEISANDIAYKTHLSLSAYYEQQQEINKFVYHYKKYYDYKEAFFGQKQQQKIKSHEMQMHMAQVEKEKELLTRKNRELENYYNDILKLSEIGRKIISSLSVEKINRIVYDSLSGIIAAEGFGIGIYNEQDNSLVFPGYIENNEVLSGSRYDLTDNTRLACICFNQDKEILINNFESEIYNYVVKYKPPIVGKTVAALIYLPLKVKDKKIGVITAQSFSVNAYSDYHLNYLKNLANYAAIALENATLYEKMESLVNERTSVILKQKEEIEKNIENTRLLSEIGQQLTTNLRLKDIFYKLYENVNKLMPAECFGVRIYHPDKDCIEYKFEIENDQIYEEPIFVPMSDDDNYSVWCVKNKQVIFINDNLNEYHQYTKKIVVPSGEMPHSLIFFPMMMGERILGVITVQSFKKFAYTPYHVDILKTLGAYTAIALENANLVENLEEKVAERTREVIKQKEEIQKTYENTQLLSQIGRELTSDLSIQKVIEKIYDKVNDLMDASIIGVGIINEEYNTLEIKGAMEKGEKLPDFSFSLDDNDKLAVWCVKNAREIHINDYQKEYKNYCHTDSDAIIGESPESILYIPLMAKNKVIGTISVQSFNKNAYNEYHLNILRNLALYASTAIENANLYKSVEQEVVNRTKEVIKQKEEIEKTYNNTRLLSEIGQEIISSHDLEDIFEKLQKNVNELMDATCFSIRIYNSEENTIEYKYTIEKGQRLPPITVSMNDIDNYSVWCVTHKKEIFINDHQNEYKKYTNKIVVVKGDLPESLIFCPMMVGEKIIGVISAQAFEKNAYTTYHLDILRTLASYTAIALENIAILKGLEHTIEERTIEVVKQKEEIQKTYENTKLLSKIGKEISALLSVEEIIQNAYSNVNNLMDATTFGIAIYRPDNNDLYYEGAIEKGVKLNPFNISLNDDKIATRCFLNKQEIIINNWEEEYIRYVQKNYTAQAGEMPESMIYLPLITKNKCIGVITVQSFRKNAYNEYHLNVIRNLSLYIASALENASLYEKMEERVAERTAEIEKAYQNTRLLSQIGKDITSCLTIESIVEKVYENVNNLMDATMFGIGIYDEDSRSILMPGFIENGVRMEDFSYNIDDERLAVICFKNQQELFINNYFEEYSKYLKGIKKAVSGKDSSSIIYLPVYSKEKIIGVITVQSYQPNAYTEYHLDILRNLSVSVGIALENAKLYLNLEEKVRERTAEVVKQKEIIEEKNKHITDSIIYAKRIQQAILPPEEVVTSHLKNAFVLYKPKDIVSGDFYWIERKDNKILFAVVDCTGHGVPGAFMSIIGFNGLNQIVNEYHITQPAEILNQLNKIISKTLKQRAEDSKIRDGMDISVCCIDLQKNTLEYAGANNPIFIIRNNEVLEINADKQPIGNFVGENEFKFTNKELQLYANDKLYLFSDGYADQFGGPKGKKLKYSNFRQLLLDNHEKPMHIQKQMLDFMFEEWKGDLEQIDDVCVIGVKI
jgi:transcriptional regulator with GAF, ATPase, and Fis domain